MTEEEDDQYQMGFNDFKQQSTEIHFTNKTVNTAAGIATTINRIDNFNFDENLLFSYQNKLNTIHHLEFKNAPALYLGWIAANISFSKVVKLLDKVEQWPRDDYKVDSVNLFRYYRYWKPTN